MKPEYKQIFVKRRKFLLGQIKLTHEFRGALVKIGLVSTSTLDELTKYQTSRSRVIHLFDFLSQSEDPDVFCKFCQVLQQCGLNEAAHTLLKDRNSIEWDFISMGGSAVSPDNYIDMINDILVRQVLVEEDRHVIRVVSKDIHSRLSALSLYLKADQGGKNNFRKAIAKMTGGGAAKLLQAAPPCINWAVHDSPFDELAASERQLDDAVLAEMRALLEQSEASRTALMDRCKFYNEAIEQFLNKDVTFRYRQSCHNKQVDTLMGMIIEQDNKILKLHDENTKVKGQVSLSKSQYGHINETIEALHNFRPRADESASGSVDVSSGPKLAAFLDDHLADVGSRTDCFRQRLRQMTERITELERERTAALAYMEAVNHRGSLSLAVRAKVEKVTRELLSKQAQKYVRNISTMARENLQLQRHIGELRDQLHNSKTEVDDSKQHAKPHPFNVVMRPMSSRRANTAESRRQFFRFG